ncbi:zf-HC2 domain-containing protein [Catenuloplanes sp. NPDC051500]|uniref:zf-HC2 domain-containing protein n=1 Tax=Catenuloplanes sp. NPDC051500 TaxID=3363959 RepID=UPI0037A82593
MADDVCAEPQLRDSLGLYLAGTLPDDECAAVESHLGTCALCLADADRLGEALAMLAILSETDRRELVAEFAARPTPAIQDQDLAGVRPALATSGPSRRPSSDRPSPAAGGSTRPGGRKQRRSRVLLAGVGLAVVLLLSTGVALGTSLMGRLGGSDAVTLLTDAEDSATGATLAVTVSDRDGEVRLRATLSGLRPAETYRLIVTDLDGRDWLMTELIGVDKPIEVEGACPVPLDRLASIRVNASDGTLAVMAVVNRAATPGSSD